MQIMLEEKKRKENTNNQARIMRDYINFYPFGKKKNVYYLMLSKLLDWMTRKVIQCSVHDWTGISGQWTTYSVKCVPNTRLELIVEKIRWHLNIFIHVTILL